MMIKSVEAKTIARGLCGALIGGAVGYLAFFWIARQGFYALVVPGALLGLVAGYFARHRSQTLGIICGVAGLLLGLVIQWQFAPFVRDGSLLYFVTHLHHLRSFTWLMLILGTYCSYRFALGSGNE
jgi:hypothetical protein